VFGLEEEDEDAKGLGSAREYSMENPRITAPNKSSKQMRSMF
jgi:hypothetical protein